MRFTTRSNKKKEETEKGEINEKYAGDFILRTTGKYTGMKVIKFSMSVNQSKTLKIEVLESSFVRK